MIIFLFCHWADWDHTDFEKWGQNFRWVPFTFNYHTGSVKDINLLWSLSQYETSKSNTFVIQIQINQIGTVTEAIEVMKLANDASWGVVISHRCGETEDSFIADFSVGLATGQIKAGAPCRGERLAKYNQVHFLSRSQSLCWFRLRLQPDT